jgi:hypothetical protein
MLLGFCISLAFIKGVPRRKITGINNSSTQDTNDRNRIQINPKENENSSSIIPPTSVLIARNTRGLNKRWKKGEYKRP